MSKDDALVAAWRLEEFERMEFSASDAILLNEWGADLHQAHDLISKGCPHALAMRILAPLEDRPPYTAGVAERIEEYSIKA